MSAQDDDVGCGDDCTQALHRLDAFLDGELPNTDVDDLREHLTACYPCTERASFEEQLRAIVRRGCTEQAPPRLASRIEAALDQGVGPDLGMRPDLGMGPDLRG